MRPSATHDNRLVRTISTTLGVGLFVAFVYWIARPVSGPVGGPFMTEVNHASEVRLALAQYAEEHDGAFPARLSDLPSERISPEAKQFHHPKTHQAQDWLYFPGHHREEQSQHTIILAAPVSLTRESKRIVVFADTSGGIISEEEFAQQIAGQSASP